MRRVLILVAFLTLVRPARADVAMLDAVADNTLYESSTGARSNGAGQHLFAGRTNDDLRRRAVIRFDLTGIPPGSSIVRVDLVMSMSRSEAGATDVALHRLLAGWGEGTSDAGGEEGGGAPSATGDATWIHRLFATDLWAAVGGDYAASVSATTAVAGVGSYTWASTPALVSDAQDWLDGVAPNHGWIVIGNESAPKTTKRFDSRSHPTAANRPHVRVEYAPPAVGACCEGGGSCSQGPPSSCTGNYQGNGTSCGAGSQCGACCDTAACVLTVAGACSTYRGDGIPCAPDPCQTPVPGACCQPDGTCSEVEAAACSGSFQGQGTACDAGGACGACCDGTSCALRVAATCSGAYQGTGVPCVPDPCTARTGACCDGEVCSDAVTAAECAAQGGEYQGDGQSCSTDPCDDRSRGCCLPGDVCSVMNRDLCDAMGGERLGGGSTCVNNPCAPWGACCTGTTCTDNLTRDQCENLGGGYLGGATCAPGTCGGGTEAACCLPGNTCAILDEIACTGLGGVYQAVGSCAPDPCAVGPCSVTLIAPLSRLMAVKTNAGNDVELGWAPDGNANGYNVWLVTRKGDLPTANASGGATAVPGCQNQPDPTCLHVGAVPSGSGPRLFYNALGACNGVEATR